MAKLGAPIKGIVYFNGEVPVLMDVNGKGDFLVPTIFSLWGSPDLLPHFEVCPNFKRSSAKIVFCIVYS